jgi:hypothetical protein
MYYLSMYLEWLRKNLRNTRGIADVLTEMRTERLSNTNLDRYRYANLLGDFLLLGWEVPTFRRYLLQLS